MKKLVQFAAAYFKTKVLKTVVYTDPQSACDHAVLLLDTGHHKRALALLTHVITAPDTPVHIRMHALRIRGTVNAHRPATRPNALADAAAILDFPEIEGSRRAEVHLFRAHILEQMENLPSAIESCTAVIHMRDATSAQIIAAHNTRSSLRKLSGDTEGALADFAAILASPHATTHDKAWALNNRHVLRQENGQTQAAIGDLTALIEMPDIAPEAKVISLLYRGQLFEADHLLRLAIADYSAALTIPAIPAELRREAIILRSAAYRHTGCKGHANADEALLFSTSSFWRRSRLAAGTLPLLLALTLILRALFLNPDTPFPEDGEIIRNTANATRPATTAATRSDIHFANGQRHAERRDWKAAIVSYTNAADAATGPAATITRARAILHRAECHERDGSPQSALADYAALANMTGATPAQRATALLRRGTLHHHAGDEDKALADYAAVTTIPAATPEIRAIAHLNEGAIHLARDRNPKALVSFTAALGIPSPDGIGHLDDARYQRAIALARLARLEASVADLNEIIDTPGVSAEIRHQALILRRDFNRRLGNAREADADTRELQTLPPPAPTPPVPIPTPAPPLPRV